MSSQRQQLSEQAKFRCNRGGTNLNDYHPARLGEKWPMSLQPLLEECQRNWDAGKPRRPWFLYTNLEPDFSHDRFCPRKDRRILAYDGFVTLAHFARAYRPAYIPGDQTHYGSVVYPSDPSLCNEIFDLAFKVNELRNGDSAPIPGTESVAAAINDDLSNFARIELPPALVSGGGRYFANICVLRGRLPLGYLHSRLVPILIKPDRTPWCTLLPLRFWSPRLIDMWSGGDPAYPVEPFEAWCNMFRVRP